MTGLQVRIWYVLMMVSYTFWWGTVDACLAQSDDVVWSRPFNLSNTPQSSMHPAIVTDGYGFVHVFWSEDVGGVARQAGDLGGVGNSILHTRWDGTDWTSPMDVLFVPGEGIAEFVSVRADSVNRLHAVWTGQQNIYYSTAPSFEAHSARAWSVPVVVATDSARTRWESDVAVDTAESIYVVYATRGSEAGVYYTVSRDGAESWDVARRLSDPRARLEEGFANVRVELAGSDHLHVVWETDEHEGYGQGVYYARSTDAGQNWSAPMQLGDRDADDVFVGWPYLMVDREPELHLIYIDGTNRGRLHRISVDDGNTWHEPVQIIPEMEGVNGNVMPVLDGLGQMHLIINMRTRSDQTVGIYYARWLGNAWSPVTPLDNSSPAAPSAHYAAAVVRLGSEIYVAYNQISPGEIWLLRGALPSAGPLAASAFPQTQVPVTLTPTRVAVSSTTPPVVQPTSVAWMPPPPPSSRLSAIEVGFPSGAALVLVMSVIAWTRARSRRVHR